MKKANGNIGIKKKIAIIILGIIGVATQFGLLFGGAYIWDNIRFFSDEDIQLMEASHESACKMAQDRMKEKYGLEGTIVECEPSCERQDIVDVRWIYRGYFDVKIETETDVINMNVYPDDGIVLDDYQAEIFYRDFEAYLLENLDIPTPYDIDIYIGNGDENFIWSGKGMLEGYYQQGQFFEAMPKRMHEGSLFYLPEILVDIKYVDKRGDLEQIFSPQLRELFENYPICICVQNYEDETYARKGRPFFGEGLKSQYVYEWPFYEPDFDGDEYGSVYEYYSIY